METKNTIPQVHTPLLPKVSIGMPVYNGEPFIREALNSLLAQTYADFELIISDNGSTDSTQVICKEFAAKDARIRYVRQAENRGALANFQFVLDESVGEYFMWAAADDRWSNLFINTCVSVLEGHCKSSFVMTKYVGISRFHAFFNRKFPDVLACIEFPDAYERVLAFTKQSFLTHKDNLVYAIWRRDFINNIVRDCGTVGGVMNELALLRGRGTYVPESLFEKIYKNIVPGHWSDWLFVKPVILFRKICEIARTGGHSREIYKFIYDLEHVMRRNCKDDDFVDKVIEHNKIHLGLKLSNNSKKNIE
jgi:glycosyltransferase involved in cell wall biosynthesis